MKILRIILFSFILLIIAVDTYKYTWFPHLEAEWSQIQKEYYDKSLLVPFREANSWYAPQSKYNFLLVTQKEMEAAGAVDSWYLPGIYCYVKLTSIFAHESDKIMMDQILQEINDECKKVGILEDSWVRKDIVESIIQIREQGEAEQIEWDNATRKYPFYSFIDDYYKRDLGLLLISITILIWLTQEISYFILKRKFAQK